MKSSLTVRTENRRWLQAQDRSAGTVVYHSYVVLGSPILLGFPKLARYEMPVFAVSSRANWLALQR